MIEAKTGQRGTRKERKGVVVSQSGDKTIVVRVERRVQHPLYKKVIRRSRKFHAHDEKGEASTGDIVRIVETRPLSKLKRWRLVEVVRKGEEAAAGKKAKRKTGAKRKGSKKGRKKK
jgi:small subunit ribosomal protein S17